MLGNKETAAESTVDRLKNKIRASRDRLRRGDGRGASSQSEPTDQPSASLEIQGRALEQMEPVLGKAEEGADTESQELGELKEAVREVCQRLEDTLDQIGTGAQRLSDERSRLALVAGRLEARVNELPRSLAQGGPPHEAEGTPEPKPVAPEEPQFQPGDQAVGIVLAAVPGFLGLMDLQRALSGLPAVEGTSVVGYKNGEASLAVVLRAPVSARQIVEGLRESTNHQLLIEEARPEALRLRLRFIDQQLRGSGASLRPELWPRA